MSARPSSEPSARWPCKATNADKLVDEALEAGLDGSHPVTLEAKKLRLEL